MSDWMVGCQETSGRGALRDSRRARLVPVTVMKSPSSFEVSVEVFSSGMSISNRESSSFHGVHFIRTSSRVSRVRTASSSFALIAHSNPPTARFKEVDGYLTTESKKLNSQVNYFYTRDARHRFKIGLEGPEESFEKLTLLVKKEVARSAKERDKRMAVYDFVRARWSLPDSASTVR